MRPGIFPPTIKIMPNSPSVCAKVKIEAVRKPRFDKGATIFINTSSVSPSTILLGYIKSKSIKGIWEKFEDFIDNKNNITLS